MFACLPGRGSTRSPIDLNESSAGRAVDDIGGVCEQLEAKLAAVDDHLTIKKFSFAVEGFEPPRLKNQSCLKRPP